MLIGAAASLQGIKHKSCITKQQCRLFYLQKGFEDKTSADVLMLDVYIVRIDEETRRKKDKEAVLTKPTYTTSPRALIEAVARTGDIATGLFSAVSMQEGAKAHRRIQKNLPASARSEVPLQTRIDLDEAVLVLNGRMDIVYEQAEGVVIEELKTTAVSPANITACVSAHVLQVQIYGYMLMKERGIDNVDVRVRYVHVSTKQTKCFSFALSFAQAKAIVMPLGILFVKKCMKRDAILTSAQKSAQSMDFPFALRAGQKEAMDGVCGAIRDKKRCYLLAPTGTGKTLAALFPALKNLGEYDTKKIFYLSAKSTGRQSALHAVGLLRRKSGLDVPALVISAKEKICLCDEVRCDPAFCPYARGHYDRVEAALEEILAHEVLFDESTVRTYSEKHRVCPYELTMDLILFSPLIIADYNYCFDPLVHLKRCFDAPASRSIVLLIDEAHNLPMRVGEMFSKTVEKRRLMHLLTLSLPKTLRGALMRLDEALASLTAKEPSGAEGVLLEGVEGALSDSIYGAMNALERYLMRNAKTKAYMPAMEMYFSLAAFMKMVQLCDEAHRVYYDIDKQALCIFLCDAKTQIAQTLDKVHSAVFFSGTLFPFVYFSELLDAREEDIVLELPSPFAAQHLLKVLYPAMDLSFKNRDGTLAELCMLIHAFFSVPQKNKIVFFPSYAYLKKTFALYELLYGSGKVLVQQPKMSIEQTQEFLKHFDAGAGVGAFAALGGQFGEGIDLPGEKLSMVMVVTVGLPQLSLQGELIKACYQERGLDGFAYAYRYPGLNKVFQALGRVIRGSEDRGCVVLVDKRYTYSQYAREFPPHLTPWQTCRTPDELAWRLEAFFSGCKETKQ